jgi:hypothetical protein
VNNGASPLLLPELLDELATPLLLPLEPEDELARLPLPDDVPPVTPPLEELPLEAVPLPLLELLPLELLAPSC